MNKQIKRFSATQYIGAVITLMLGLTALTYAAGALTLFDTGVISASAVNNNFNTLDTKINTVEINLQAVDAKLPALNTIKLGAPVAATGNAIDFANIPAGVKRVKLAFMGVSLSGAADYLIQIGPGSGFETFGYNSQTILLGNVNKSSTTGFIINAGDPNQIYSGIITIELVDEANNMWMLSGTFKMDSGGYYIAMHNGFKSLTGVLSKLRLTTTGADTFDLGKVSVSWEF